MNFIDQHKLALSLGAEFVVGYWRFPSPEAKASFERQVAGLEWTDAQRKKADKSLTLQQFLNRPLPNK